MGSIQSTYSNERLTHSNVKLHAQSMPSFNGSPHKWQTWKKRARATIGSAGYLNVLDDEAYATSHRMQNETVFHLLQNSVIEGNAAHLVDQYEPERDGRKAYLALVNWYEGEKQVNSTAEDIRAKLERNFLTTKNPGTEYINKFQMYSKQLDDLGEAYTASKSVSLFLEKITDPDYENVVELCMAQELDLEKCIYQIRSKERRLDRDRSNSRKKGIIVRRNEQEQIPDMTHEKEDMFPSIEYLTDAGYYSIPGHVWSTMNAKEQSKVKQHNSTLRKKRKALENNSNTRQFDKTRDITTRRNPIPDHNDSQAKRRRTVEIKDDEVQSHTGVISPEDEPKSLSTRRGILQFQVNENRQDD